MWLATWVPQTAHACVIIGEGLTHELRIGRAGSTRSFEARVRGARSEVTLSAGRSEARVRALGYLDVTGTRATTQLEVSLGRAVTVGGRRRSGPSFRGDLAAGWAGRTDGHAARCARGLAPRAAALRVVGRDRSAAARGLRRRVFGRRSSQLRVAGGPVASRGRAGVRPGVGRGLDRGPTRLGGECAAAPPVPAGPRDVQAPSAPGWWSRARPSSRRPELAGRGRRCAGPMSFEWCRTARGRRSSIRPASRYAAREGCGCGATAFGSACCHPPCRAHRPRRASGDERPGS
jgi:hypothetical protein